MFQAALLAFKNKKDNELTEAIEKGVLHQNGYSDGKNSYYSAPNVTNANNYHDTDTDRNIYKDKQEPLQGWRLVRKAVVQNSLNDNQSPNQTYLKGRIERLQKLTQEVEVKHAENKLKYEYQMNLPDCY